MRRLLLALGLVLLAASPAAAQEPADLAGDVAGTRVVVVGAPGLRWDDVDPFSTPVLHRLAQDAAVGVLSVRARPLVGCPPDGWLTLGAGGRAEAFGVPCEGGPPPDDLRARNLATREVADVRALADALADDGRCLAARGAGAALTGGDPDRRCPVLVVEAPAVTGDAGERRRRAAEVDAVVGAVQAARSEGSDLLVVGVSAAAGESTAHLHLALADGPSFAPGALRSASTRRAPYVQLVDVAPTVLDLLDLPRPDGVVGQPWRSSGTAPGVEALAGLDARAVAARATTVPFFVVLLAGLLGALAAARARRSWRTAEVAGLAAVAALGASALAVLVPWWRAPVPLLGLLAVTGLLTAGAVALARRTRRPVLAVVGGLAVLLVGDLLTGARLQLDTPVGYSPLVAGRFAGLGNVGFGVVAAAVLLALALSVRGRGTALGGAAAVVAVGAPSFGSDVGGVLALVPGLVVLGLLRSGRRVRLPLLAAAGAAGAAVVVVFGLLDLRRPADRRTHLGRFLQDVVDGRAGTVLVRKAGAVVDLLTANALTLLLPVVLAAAVLLVLRPPAPLRRLLDAVPAWRHGLAAVGAASGVGLVVNDSGPAVPALALLVAGPATVALLARVAGRPGNEGPRDG
ncbi:MAG TPA: hypothetical protein VNU66_10255 [Mycobacteriales bacterium]|nr:hypothetical protein [Mycobacteriales bacterium]